MSFTRRNVAIRSVTQRASTQQSESTPPQQQAVSVRPPAAERLPGTRPSPVDGRPTTSTGCLSLDGLLAGHAGLPLGHSVLVGENGTTDYASTLLRYFAAEGVEQGHKVHVVGFAESWGRALPLAIGAAHSGERGERGTPASSDRMKIAWRYERLGEFGAGNAQGLTRWMELLSDGVLELVPFPHDYGDETGRSSAGPSSTSSLGKSGAATALEEKPQGMLRVHRLPVFHERGGGGIGSAGVEDDLAFTVSRKRFVIKPFSLPPLEGDQEAQAAAGEQGAAALESGGAKTKKGLPRKEDLEF